MANKTLIGTFCRGGTPWPPVFEFRDGWPRIAIPTKRLQENILDGFT
jgi:hypothetical protein